MKILLFLLLIVNLNAEILYQDDFGLRQWELTSGEYEVQGGWLNVKSGESNPFARLLVTHSGNGTFRATLKGSRDNHLCGISAKEYLLIASKEYNQIQLLKNYELILAIDNYTIYCLDLNKFELRLTFEGNKICGYIDNHKLFEHYDTQSGDEYGLISGWDSDISYSNVRLSDIPNYTEESVEDLPALAMNNLCIVSQVRGNSWNYYNGIVGFDVGLYTKLSPQSVLLEFRIVDIYGNIKDTKQNEIELTSILTNFKVEFMAQEKGCFKMELWITNTWVEDIGSFAVLDRAVKDIKDNYFGGHIDAMEFDDHIVYAENLGVTWVRWHDMIQWGWWNVVQPTVDEWNFYGDVTKLENKNIKSLGEFLWIPYWAGSANNLYPDDINDFRTYVSNTVMYYSNVMYWEVWNESHYELYWQGTPEEYVSLVNNAYDVIKSIDTNIQVVAGAGIYLSDLTWISNVLNAGMNFDILSIHYFDITQVDNFNKVKEWIGNKPIWNTEESIVSSSFLNQCRNSYRHPEAKYHYRNACCEVVKTCMDNISNGIDKVFYYAQADPWRFQEYPKARILDNIMTGMIDENHAVNPFAMAYSVMSLMIDDCKYQTNITANDCQSYLFSNDKKAIAVQYLQSLDYLEKRTNRIEMTTNFNIDNFKHINLMGNSISIVTQSNSIVLPLSREPVYLEYYGENEFIYDGDKALEILKEMLK